MDVVYLQAYHETEVTVKGIVSKKVLGVPTEYEDDVGSFMNAKQKYTNTKEIVDESQSIGAMMILSYEFYDHEFIKELYTMQDIVSALGGIAASINMVMGFLATASVFVYLVKLGQLIQRKYKYKYHKCEIYKMMKYFEGILMRQNRDSFS